MLNKHSVSQRLTLTTTPSILVIGDVMMDHYMHGAANRLSPEAPVPIVNVIKERQLLGGAANVALNLKTLGADVSLMGVIGDDGTGEKIRALANNHLIDIDNLLIEKNRPTTVKSRVVVGAHQMLRFDKESTLDIDKSLVDSFMSRILDSLDSVDLLLISDYGKGLLTPALTQFIISTASKKGKKVLVDPKGINYEKYKGAYIIKPNRKELQEVFGITAFATIEEVAKASKKLLSLTQSDYIITTLSEDGMALTHQQKFIHFPVKATEVFDVTGAGDTVLAALSYFISKGFDIESACELANYAAAIVVKHVGSASVTIQEILDNMEG